MSAHLQVILRCDAAGCIASTIQDTRHRTLARRRAAEKGWRCDPRGGNDRCPAHREVTT